MFWLALSLLTKSYPSMHGLDDSDKMRHGYRALLLVALLVVHGACECVRTIMAGWLHGYVVTAC